MAEERRKISELPSNDSPSASTILVGVDNGETVKIPITELVTKDEDGNVTLNDSLDVNGSITCNDGITSKGTLEVTYGNPIRVWNDDNTKSVSLFCSADGEKIETNNATLATESYVDEKVAKVSGCYECTVNAGSTMLDLLNDLTSKGYTAGDTMMLRLQGSKVGNYVGYIELLADGRVCRFYLLEISTATLYTYPNGVATSTNLGIIFDGATKTELAGGITEEELEARLTEFAGSIGGSSNYIYEVQDSSATMLDLINCIESQGYISDTIMLLQLDGARLGKYIGSINFFAGKGMCTFNLLDVNTATLYYASTSSTSVPILTALENATQTKLTGGGSSGGIIDVEEFPSNPSTTAIYRKWQVIKAEWVMDGVIVTDGGMTCEVVNTLPEVGEICYTGETMYSYYNRADGECYGYVDSNLSAMMSVPVGWYPAAVLFGALEYTYNGMIDSLASATDGYSLLLTKKPHLYHFYDDGKGNNVKSAIITNDNYEFDEATGTLTQHIIL